VYGGGHVGLMGVLADAVLAGWGEVPIVIDASVAMAWCFDDEATDETLSAYDAAYLVLAERLAAPLATTDGKLTAACRTAGVRLLVQR